MRPTYLAPLAMLLCVVCVGCDGDTEGDTTTDVDDTAVETDTKLDDTTDDVEDTTVADTTVECPAPTGARPRARAEHAGVYDPVNHQLVTFGGSFGVPVNCSSNVAHTYEADTWIYDLSCDQWRQSAVDTGPKGRVRHSAVYDSAGHRMVIYGGRERPGSSGTYTLHGEVMAFDLTTETWSELAPSGVAGGPAPRYNATAVYNAAANVMLVFGGNTSASGAVYSDSNEVWSFDLANYTWTEVTVQGAGKPSGRFWAAGVWDSARSWFVIYGGSDDVQVFSQTARYERDVWALDFVTDPPTWYRLDTQETRPLGRFWAGLVHDQVGDRLVMFGGHDDQNLGNRNDMWALAPLAGAWTELNAGDTANKPPTAFCDFPPDFTLVDKTVPERRHAHVFVGNGEKAWLTGGKTDCGNVDDVFEFDLATDTWTELTTATVGEACIRKGGIDCNDMCF
ncbi:MAG: hypothetical protein ACI9MR_002893 [Myxococcota bacterium]|jgi:hypothetical protein